MRTTRIHGKAEPSGFQLKPVLSILLATVLVSLVAGTPAASGRESWYSDPDSYKGPSFVIDPENGNQLVSIEESSSPRQTVVSVGFKDPRVDKNPQKVAICQEIGINFDCGIEASIGSDTDEKEASPKVPYVSGSAILPFCGSGLENCIESLELRPTGEDSFIKARFQNHAPGPRFIGSPTLGIPSGTGLSIFSSEAGHTGGSEYSVRARLGFNVTGSSTNNPPTVKFREFELEVLGTKSSPRSSAKVPVSRLSDRPGKSTSSGGTPPDCAYSGDGYCGVIHDLEMSTDIKVTLILSNELTGWLRGRVQQGTFEVKELSEMYSRVIVSGKPADVPKFLATHSLERGDPDVVGDTEENSYRGKMTLVPAASAKAMNIVQAMKESVEDTATAVVPVWSLNSIAVTRSKDNKYKECSRKNPGLVGVVSTNAMAFDGAAPIFSDGYFSYNVSGLHYAPDGITKNLGTYDLSIRSDFARCLYGYSNAPISATVSVLGEQGQENIATEVVSERNGWLNLSARGFTFSEKELQVRIGQSQIRTLDAFSGSRTSLTSRQKSQIRSVVEKSKGNAKFICTGIRYYQQPMSVNVMVRKRAKEACEYAKSLNPDFSFWFQTKPTKARSYAGKVLLVSKN